MNTMAITLGGLLAGILLQNIKDFSASLSECLTKYAIWIALPAIILHKIPALSYSRELLVTLIMPWSFVALGALLVLILSTLLKWSKNVTGAMLLAVPLGNTSFFGIPMITLLLGEQYGVYGIMYDQFGSFLAVATYGAIVLAVYGNTDKPTIAKILKKIMTFPPFVALITALLIGKRIMTFVPEELFFILGATMVPAMMIAIGLKLKLTPASDDLIPFGIGLGLRLVLFPFISLSVCLQANIHSEVIGVAILESGMPSMLTAGILAMNAGLAPQLVASLIGWGMLLSFVTLPIFAFFIRTGVMC